MVAEQVVPGAAGPTCAGQHDVEMPSRGDALLVAQVHPYGVVTDRLWGVDFEESRNGKPVEDIAGVCASLLSSDPMFTGEKLRLCKLFIHSYGTAVEWSLGNVTEEIAYALLERIQWRPDDEETLRKHSKEIREQGIKK